MGNTNGADRRGAAKAFVRRWRDRGDERQDTQAFWLDLLTSVFDMRNAAEVCRFEHPVKTMASDHTGYADLWVEPARLLVEQKGAGIDLAKKEPRQGRMVTPAEQARDYANGIPLSQRPKYIVACNFREFWFYNLDLDPQCRKPYLTVSLDQLPDNLAAFAMLEGGEEAQAVLTRQVSVEAGRIMGDLHRLASEAYVAAGADPDDPKVHHALAVLMTRLMFLLFCEDSGIIEADAFKDYLKSFKYENYQTALQDLFAWLDTKDEDRNPYLSDDDPLRKFPYMNGGLYREKIFLPKLGDSFAHTLLVNASQEFNWAGVSPTVFGSIFEGALSHDHRRANGQHFTSVESIHRVLDPLCLDGLELEFEEACAAPVAGGARTKALGRLNDKLGTLVFLDPAAGSGNFLTEAYLSLRRLENRIFIELQRDSDAYQAYMPGFGEDEGHNLDVTVSLANFHGIELEDYACCVARTALWIAEQQANIATQRITGRPYEALPLNDYEGIVCANALRIDWNQVVPANRVTHICGNPPFLGSYRLDAVQKADRKNLFGAGGGVLDYVACWYLKAAEYMGDEPIRAAFVSTNSICPGQQVEPLWRRLFSLGFHIDFAWTTFYWSSEADDPAHVHVVIVGFSKTEGKLRVLHRTREGETVLCDNINGYLMAAPDWFVTKSTRQVSGVPEMSKGFQATDHGFLLMDGIEKDLMEATDPGTSRWIRPFSMGADFVQGNERYCLWLPEATMADIAAHPLIEERVQACRDWRESQTKTGDAYKLRGTPQLLRPCNKFKDGTFIGVPKVTSANRAYIPMGFVTDGMIPGDKLYFIPTGSLFLFGVLMSRFHNAWMRMTCGRLKSDYSYSNTIVYNTFVFPAPTESQRAEVERCAQAVLDARAAHPDSSLAEMYDGISPVPDGATGTQARKFDRFAFSDLKAAHEALDAAVEAAYGVDFDGDEERIVSHLFGLYAEAVGEGDR